MTTLLFSSYLCSLLIVSLRPAAVKIIPSEGLELCCLVVDETRDVSVVPTFTSLECVWIRRKCWGLVWCCWWGFTEAVAAAVTVLEMDLLRGRPRDVVCVTSISDPLCELLLRGLFTTGVVVTSFLLGEELCLLRLERPLEDEVGISTRPLWLQSV